MWILLFFVFTILLLLYINDSDINSLYKFNQSLHGLMNSNNDFQS